MYQKQALSIMNSSVKQAHGAVRMILLLIALPASEPALAHKVYIFALVEGDQIYVQGYFLDGKKAKNSKVTVYSDKDEVLNEGLTNDEGEYVFVMPAHKQGMRIVLNAGEGHQAEYKFGVAELTAGSGGAPTKEGGTSASDNASAAPQEPANRSMELTVKRAVAEAVMPLARELAELKERRSLSDIVGGIGFIVGILGGFAYYKARERM